MNEELIKRYWQLFDEGDFDLAGELMSDDANVCLPNTREVFHGRNKFILFNKKYPGRWRITIERIHSIEDMVVSAVKVESEDKQLSFYATSFFMLKNNLIQEVTEYWGENGEPPAWRNEGDFSERY